MTIQTDVYNLLKAVNSNTFPLVAPQKVSAPFVIYTKISAEQDRILEGSIGLYDTTYQVDVYAATILAACTIADQIKSALVDHNGTGNSPPDSIRWCRFIDERQFFDDTAEPELYRVSMDFTFRHEQA